jgi:predicted transcriptional regulator
MDKEAIEEAIEVLEDASAEMLAETGDENYYAEAIAILRQALVDADDTSQERVDETSKAEHEWVGLTLNEAEDFYDKYTDRAELINAIDKFLAEKNHG